jgi:hypothetical protein
MTMQLAGAQNGPLPIEAMKRFGPPKSALHIQIVIASQTAGYYMFLSDITACTLWLLGPAKNSQFSHYINLL